MNAAADTTTDLEAPWKSLRAALEREDAQGIEELLRALPAVEAAVAVSRLRRDEQAHLVALMHPELAGDVLLELAEETAADVLDELPVATAAAIVDALPSDRQADILARLDDADAERILAEMSPAEASHARRLMDYDADSAGGVMGAEYVKFRADLTVEQVVQDLRAHSEEYSDYSVQYAYVVEADERLVGVLPLRDLLLSPPRRTVGELMIRDPLAVSGDTPLEELEHLFNQHSFVGVPVTDESGRLIGVVQRASARRAAERRAGRMLLAFSGIVGGEELRSMSLTRRASRRLSWLSINIGLNLIAASVIAIYQDVLEAAIALAVFLPVISDMSGCSGNQAVAVSMRELTAGLVRPREVLRVLGKEAALGIVNGVVLGLLLGAAAWLWKGNFYLGGVVGVALMVNTLLAVCLGGTIPLLLKGLEVDPALASGPMLTTLTDMCGFLLVLSLASAVLPQLA